MTNRIPLGTLLLALACCAPPASTPPQAPRTAAAATVPAAPPTSVTSAAAPTEAQAPNAEEQAIAQRLVGSALVGGHAMDYLRELADGIGPRLTGSDGYARAAAWAIEAFHNAGVANAAAEPFTMAHGWQRGAATLKVVAPVERPLHALAFGWGPNLPKGGLRAEVVSLEDFTPQALDAALKDPDRVRGKIVLHGKGPGKTGWAIDQLAAHGAVALLSAEIARDDEVLVARAMHPLTTELVGTLPGAMLGTEDAAYLKRLLQKEPVTVTLSDDSRLLGPVQVPNVVAEIRGREVPDEWVLVGAHLDSWDLAAGAQDNASGAAEVLEAARAIHALGTAPRRSIRFALWAAEEEGLRGSQAYVAAHAAELDRAVFVLNTDSGAGQPTGWDLSQSNAAAAFRAATGSLLSGLGADETDPTVHCWGDDCPFLLAGVPTAGLLVPDLPKYLTVWHNAGDTLEKVTPGPVGTAAAIVAVTAFAIADAPARIAPRLDHASVKANLEKADVDPNLVARGLWRP